MSLRVAASLTDLSHDPRRIHETVDRILDAPAYQPPPTSAWQRLLDEIWIRVAGLLGWVGRVMEGDAVAWTVVAAVLIATAVLSVGLVRRMTGDRTVQAAGTATGPRPAAAWDAEAEAHERAARWRQAVRCRYRGAIARLDADGVVEEADGRTVGEYRRAVAAAAPAIAARFAAASDLFEAVWYAGAPASPEAARRVRELTEPTS